MSLTYTSSSSYNPWAKNYIQGLMGSAATTQTGLSDAQQAATRARLGLQNESAVNNSLQGLAKNTGVNSPLYALNAARLKAGAASSADATMANQDANNAQQQIQNNLNLLDKKTNIANSALNEQSQELQWNEDANKLQIARLQQLGQLLPQYWNGATRQGSGDAQSIRNANEVANTSNLATLKSLLSL